MPKHEDLELRDYLQKVVGLHGRTTITSAVIYDTWGELPWGDDPPALDPLPEGPAVLIGMRDMLLMMPGPEAFIALPVLKPAGIAMALAEKLIKARAGGKGLVR